MTINRTDSLFFITKKSIISAKSPGFIIFWRTLICSPVIKIDSGLCFITFTLCNSYKSEGCFGFYYRHWNDHYKSEGKLSFYYRHWNDRTNRGLSKIMPATKWEKIWIPVVRKTTGTVIIACIVAIYMVVRIAWPLFLSKALDLWFSHYEIATNSEGFLRSCCYILKSGVEFSALGM